MNEDSTHIPDPLSHDATSNLFALLHYGEHRFSEWERKRHHAQLNSRSPQAADMLADEMKGPDPYRASDAALLLAVMYQDTRALDTLLSAFEKKPDSFHYKAIGKLLSSTTIRKVPADLLKRVMALKEFSESWRVQETDGRGDETEVREGTIRFNVASYRETAQRELARRDENAPGSSDA